MPFLNQSTAQPLWWQNVLAIITCNNYLKIVIRISLNRKKHQNSVSTCFHITLIIHTDCVGSFSLYHICDTATSPYCTFHDTVRNFVNLDDQQATSSGSCQYYWHRSYPTILHRQTTTVTGHHGCFIASLVMSSVHYYTG